MNIIRRVPVPMSGLALGLAALGLNLEVALASNLPQAAPAAKAICGWFSALVLLLVILRLILDSKGSREELSNVVPFSVFPTFFMATMILATYIKPMIGQAAFYLWVIALVAQLVWVAAFIIKYVFSFDVKNVFPSWFLVFVGFVVGTTTSPAFAMVGVGRVLLWAGLIGYAFMIPVVMYRMVKLPQLPPPAKPTVAITLAPPNLILAGHLALVKAGAMTPIKPLIYVLLVLSGLSLLFVIVSCAPVAFKKFFPSFSAFTFPFVICSIAITNLSLKLMTWLAPVATVLQLLAVLMVVYVLVRYLVFLFSTPEQKA